MDQISINLNILQVSSNHFQIKRQQTFLWTLSFSIVFNVLDKYLSLFAQLLS